MSPVRLNVTASQPGSAVRTIVITVLETGPPGQRQSAAVAF